MGQAQARYSLFEKRQREQLNRFGKLVFLKFETGTYGIFRQGI